MPILTFPLALLGLAAPLGLVGIYLLRNRFRRQRVSSLLLWADHRVPREGGAKMQRWRAPWLFVLELLAMLLLVGAAIGPRWLSSMSDSPLVVVLDDSYSMRTKDGEGRTALEKGREAVEREMGSGRFDGRLILAGDRLRVVGAEDWKAGWDAGSGGADLSGAVALATELGGPRGRVMVVTDHTPTGSKGEGRRDEGTGGRRDEERSGEDVGGRVRWRAFGEARGNAAIVSAARSGGRVMVEVANFSGQVVTTTMDVGVTANAKPQAAPGSVKISLGAGERKRVMLDVGEDAGTVTVRLGADALEADNEAVLPPEVEEPLRVWVNVKQEAMRGAVERALEATGRVKLVTGGGELVVTDAPGSNDESADGMWKVELVRGEKVRGYVGPFVVDRGNALTEGLALRGVVWGAGEDVELGGRPLVMAGEKTLVSEEVGRDRTRVVRMAINGEATNMGRMVDWPVWWWNVVRWREEGRAGLRPVMVRLGGEAELKVGEGVKEVNVRVLGDDANAKPQAAPGSKTLGRREVYEGRVVIEADQLGRWEISTGDKRYELAVNALNGDESDVRGAGSGSWGRWVDEPGLRREYANFAWAAAMGATGLLLVHLWMVGERAGRQSTVGRQPTLGKGGLWGVKR
ncbi:MAG: BatA domain-containing protein [Phycisphaerales bacterium]